MVKKIAVTGGIGSGKSLVMQCIRELGYPVFSCDEIYKEISKTADFTKKIKEFLPSCVRNDTIDRQALADIVFNNKEQLEILNKISHPIIMDTLHKRMENCSCEIAFAEVPLLFEGGYEKDFHETIFVKRNLKERIRAIIQRDKTDEESALKRIHSQFDPESKEGQEKLKSTSVFILDNNFDLNHIKSQLKICLEKHT